LGQVRLHDAVDHSLDRCFIAAGAGLYVRTGVGKRSLRDKAHRRQNRDYEDQAKTSRDAMHNLFSRQSSVCENDDL
jgi:hypothetical protein